MSRADDGADRVSGDALSDRLVGGKDDDTLRGLQGADLLIGNTG